MCVCVCVFGNLDVGCAGLLLGSFFRIWDRRELFSLSRDVSVGSSSASFVFCV